MVHSITKTESEIVDKVRDYVKNKKAEGAKKISDFEIMDHFHIAIEEVDAALFKLRDEGLIHEPKHFRS